MEQIERIEHDMTCDCGATIPMIYVRVYEDGVPAGVLKEARIEGEAWWAHLNRCPGKSDSRVNDAQLGFPFRRS